MRGDRVIADRRRRHREAHRGREIAVAVRAETGKRWQDHREVDFLICHNGAWGILEVAYHPDRYEKDSEKDHWFKKSGILCIQHYTAERCCKEAGKVIAGTPDLKKARHRVSRRTIVFMRRQSRAEPGMPGFLPRKNALIHIP